MDYHGTKLPEKEVKVMMAIEKIAGEQIWRSPYADLDLFCFFAENEHVTKLRLVYGSMHSLPKNIGNLEKLRELDLDNNKLTTIPKSIGKLQNLENFLRSIHMSFLFQTSLHKNYRIL